MEKQIISLIKACEHIGLTHHFIDAEKNLVQVTFPWGVEYFQINKTPFNREVVMGLFRDKKHTYDLLHAHINMPKTRSFLDFDVPMEYRHYCNHHSIPEIVDAMTSEFQFPVIVKCNSGALGIGVYLCQDQQQASHAFQEIFNKQSKDYDYLALAQQFVPTQLEYRLVCAFGEPLLAYQRGNTSGFNARYWDKEEIATLVTNPEILQRLQDFVKPIFKQLEIGFVGCDIILSEENELFLIELNSSPKFNNFIKNNDESHVVEMYIQALQRFIKINKHRNH